MSPHGNRPHPIRVHHQRANAVRRPKGSSAAGKIASASLATVTCIGLAGVLAVRAAEDSAAAVGTSTDTGSSAQQATEPTTSTGLTQADLDAYAQQLDDEAQRLADYRAQLIDVANRLQQVADGQASGSTSGGRKQQAPAKPSTSAPSTSQSSGGQVAQPAQPEAPAAPAAPPAKPAPQPAPRPQQPQQPAQGTTQGS